MTPKERLIDVIDGLVDPLGLMPNDELTLHLVLGQLIADARSEALEEAARVAESFDAHQGWGDVDKIAAAIRALKE